LLETLLNEFNSGPESTERYAFGRKLRKRRRSRIFHKNICIPSDPKACVRQSARSLKTSGAKFMSQASVKIQLMRDQQLTRGMQAAAIIGFFTLLCSTSRIWFVGWHDIMYLHIALYLIILAAVLLDRRLSFRCKAIVITGVSFILGVGSLIVWGFAAFSLLALFCFCILSTILFGTRAGIISCAICIGIIGIVGACVYAGIHTYRFDATIHINSPALWLTAVFGMALSAGIIVIVLGTLNRQVEDLVQAMERQNNELQENNLLLRYEIAERIRAEEERKKLESKLQAAQKMEVIGTLAGGVAHDLNNILGGIVGYPDMLLEELPSQSPLRGTVETIRKSGIKAAAIVNDMLTLARRRIESTEVISINTVVTEYCTSPEFETLKYFHPSVEVEIQSDPNLMNIHGSIFHLSKVLMNLVSNAAEAMPNGGRILISTENRDISGREGRHEEIIEGSYAVLSVEDTGIGIPAEDLEWIFEPFYSKKKMGRSGTGLGMAVVWGSVKDHNGYIDVESVEGKGTKFTLYFPSTMEQAALTQIPVPRTDLRGRGESILVVDDVQEQREIASRILRELGYSVQALGSGEEAIEYLKAASADLLILDMLMEPGIDGLETYKKITKLHPGQRAIITTGYAETARIKEALRLGAGRYLKKPYLINDIGLAVKAELGNRLNGQSESSPGLWN
jgi:signal transduction histidine kinase/ActR/RegA family two-component response regulator